MLCKGQGHRLHATALAFSQHPHTDLYRPVVSNNINNAHKKGRRITKRRQIRGESRRCERKIMAKNQIKQCIFEMDFYFWPSNFHINHFLCRKFSISQPPLWTNDREEKIGKFSTQFAAQVIMRLNCMIFHSIRILRHEIYSQLVMFTLRRSVARTVATFIIAVTH